MTESLLCMSGKSCDTYFITVQTMCRTVKFFPKKMMRRLFLQLSRQFSFNIKQNLTNNLIIGSYAELEHSFTLLDLQKFSLLCGDANPLHLDLNYVKTNSKFQSIICHGILVSSLFSTLLGQTIPGSIYLKQNLNFKKPVYVNGKN